MCVPTSNLFRLDGLLVRCAGYICHGCMLSWLHTAISIRESCHGLGNTCGTLEPLTSAADNWECIQVPIYSLKAAAATAGACHFLCNTFGCSTMGAGKERVQTGQASQRTQMGPRGAGQGGSIPARTLQLWLGLGCQRLRWLGLMRSG